MDKSDLDLHLEAMVGRDLVESWWNNPNKYWGGFTPLQIYDKSDEGKKEVEEYIMLHCYGGW